MLSMEEIQRGLRLLEEARWLNDVILETRKRTRGYHCLEPFRLRLIEMFHCADVEFLNVDFLYNDMERKGEFYITTGDSDKSEEFILEFKYKTLDNTTEEYRYLVIKPLFSKRFGIENLHANKSGKAYNVQKFAEGIPQLRELINELLK